MNEAQPATYALSAAQLGIWMAQRLSPANALYNVAGYLDINGPVIPATFAEALKTAVGEAEALRVRIVEVDQHPRQVVLADGGPVLEDIDLSAQPDPAGQARAWMDVDVATPVDLGLAPLCRFVLIKLGDERYHWYTRFHHILMDGSGYAIFARRVEEVYAALATGSPCPPARFGSLAGLLAEEQTYRDSADFERDRGFWTAALTPLPARDGAVPGAAFIADRLVSRRTPLPASITAGLADIATRTGARWSTVVTAALVAYLHRTSGTADVTVTLPVPARLTDLSLRTPAMLLNEVPLRVAVTASTSVEDLIARVAQATGDAFAHQRFRGEDLYRELGVPPARRGFGGPQLNIIAFNQTGSFAGHPATYQALNTGPVQNLLVGFYGESDGSDLALHLDANPKCYDGDALAGLEMRFLALLDAMLRAPAGAAVGQLALMPSSERDRLVNGLNQTRRDDLDLTACLHEMVEAQARRTPEAPALVWAAGSLSYGDLWAGVVRLAHHLRERGVRAGHRVGVCDVRSPELVVSLLAAMKAGAAYVPLDPDVPLPRLALQIEDADIGMVLTRSTLAGRFAGTAVTTVPVDEVLPELPEPAGPLPKTSRSGSPAYVLYTSGSTGRPKGVVVPHRGVANRLLWMQELFGLTAEDCVLQKTPFTFDVSVWEFFWPLICGSRLFLAEPGRHRDPRYLARVIRERQVTVVHFVPGMLDTFLLEPSASDAGALRAVVCSGETLRGATVREFFARFGAGAELYNLYGPTEASIDVTYWRCRPEDAQGPVPIGRPVANTRIYLLDAAGEPVPAGLTGELCIGGVQVASGYLNRDELTAQRFTTDPFAGGTMYRTGDLARYRDDGAIEFLGRADDQVKVRGFRIEPGDVEAALETHPGVDRAVVVLWERTAEDRRLVAYVVARTASAPGQPEAAQPGVGAERVAGAGGVPDQEALTSWLAQQLPEYMVPAHVVFLDEFPVGSTGKIDRSALPDPVARTDAQADADPRTLPSTPAEELLHAVWREILGVLRVGVTDSFFALGGDSMLSIRMRAAVERRGYTFDTEDLFRAPTIRELAGALRTRVEVLPGVEPFQLIDADDRELLPDGLDDAYPLCAMQAGMLFHTARDGDSAVYRVVTSVRVGERFVEEILARCVDAVVRRHPALRTSFDLAHYSQPLQLVHHEVKVPLEVAEDLGAADPAAQRAAIGEWMARAKYRQFDPATPPLLAFTVHPAGPSAFHLSVVEHHAILDGWSDMGMLREIADRYRSALGGASLTLPEVPARFSDFVEAERRTVADSAAREFWTRTLRDVEPGTLPRPVTGALAGGGPVGHRALPVPIPADVAQRLEQGASRGGVPVKALLAAAHAIVMRTLTGRDEVLVGLVANGRLERDGGDETIGVFLNTLPLPVDAGGGSWLTVARRVFERERDALPYRRYPFAQMQRDLGGELRLDSYVNVMAFGRQWRELTDPDVRGVAETNFPLTVNFLVEPGGELGLYLDCDLAVLDADLCERLVGYYGRALDLAARDPDADVDSVSLLGDEERALLDAWNATGTGYDDRVTIPELIERRAVLAGDAIAVLYRSESLTYTELDTRMNRLAHHLRGRGAGPGMRVGVCLARGPELVVALGAVLRSGAAYVPLDPAFPVGRNDFIARDAGIGLLLTDHDRQGLLPGYDIILVDGDAPAIAACPAWTPQTVAAGDDPAYVMYTSGSTGRPKGAVVTHRNVANFLGAMDVAVGCGAQDVVLASTSVSFDISLLELLWPLTRGARVVIAGDKLIESLVPDARSAPPPAGASLIVNGTVDGPAASLAAQAGARGFRTGYVRSAGGQLTEATNEPEKAGAAPAPAWLTSASAPALFAMAGATGASLFVVPLLDEGSNDLVERIAAYRAGAQHAPEGVRGHLGVLLPTAVEADAAGAARRGRAQFREYLRRSPHLWPALFAAQRQALRDRTPADELDPLLDAVVDRFWAGSTLAGTPSSVAAAIRDLAALGVDEIACLVDLPADATGPDAAWPAELDTLSAAFAPAGTADSLVGLCGRHGVTLVQATPSFFAAVEAVPAALRALRGVRTVLVGGEAFPPGLARRLASALPHSRILNMYGPTETTVWSTSHELRGGDGTDPGGIPIGRPVANTRALVLDPARRPVPVGVAGELWIAGDGVAAGYLDRPELTAERFVSGPDTGVMYRTGDRVRWRPDGLLEYLGRVDRQVKILGHRVEPEEVERVLSSAAQASPVAVVAVPSPSGSVELVAYVAPPAGATDDGLSHAHVDQWADVWEDTYTRQQSGRFAGWNSSYTRNSIPAWQMEEWLIHTVNRIAALRPESLVECGVGTGLLLGELALRVRRYRGYDIAPAALAAARAALPPFAGTEHVTLERGDARCLRDLADGEADTVVLNSVVQYFPSTQYLTEVLEQAVRVAGSSGAVFIGDVRDLDLLDVFHADVELHRAPPQMPARQIWAAAQRHARDERELCLSARFFRDFAQACPAVGRVRIEPKRGYAVNEMTAFRYDVTLLRGDRDPMARAETLPFQGLGEQPMATLSGLLTGDPAAGAVAVRDIPDARIARARRVHELLSGSDPATTAWELERELWGAGGTTGASPERIARLGEQAGYRALLLRGTAGDVFDVVFEPVRRNS